MSGPQSSGFESETRKPERRDFFDLRRRLSVLERPGSGSGSADIDGGDPSGSGTGFIDGGGA